MLFPMITGPRHVGTQEGRGSHHTEASGAREVSRPVRAQDETAAHTRGEANFLNYSIC